MFVDPRLTLPDPEANRLFHSGDPEQILLAVALYLDRAVQEGTPVLVRCVKSDELFNKFYQNFQMAAIAASQAAEQIRFKQAHPEMAYASQALPKLAWEGSSNEQFAVLIDLLLHGQYDLGELQTIFSLTERKERMELDAILQKIFRRRVGRGELLFLSSDSPWAKELEKYREWKERHGGGCAVENQPGGADRVKPG